VGCCTFTSTAADLPEGSVPIGRPISNTRLTVVSPDDWTVPAGPGEVGELLIAGDCLARGYLGAPAATAARFLPDPFGPAGARTYRTGDLARCTPAGQLVYCGRADGQVKINGHRVELAEIAAAARAHRDVQQAAATMEGTVLVVYVIPREPARLPTVASLFDELTRRLPRHMLPRRATWLTTLPLTVNGKVATAALGRARPLRRDDLAGRFR
jgi:acyl-coenzyme A synthetase/AMP-(fatty) acid ligase